MKTNSHIVIILLSLLIAGCNVLQNGDELPVISANVLPSTAGSVLISGQGSEDQQVELLAVANQNWRFSNWSGDIESDENPLNIRLSENTELFANFVLSGNEYRVDMELSDGENFSVLSFGQIPGATDAFDTNLDLESPPQPPDGVFYAWFEVSDRQLLHDFRNPYTPSSEWTLNIEPGNTGLISLSWEIQIENLPGSLVLTDLEASLEVDLLEENSAQLNVEEPGQFLIRYLPDE
ncbi:MAG: hypothetical protein GVY07_11920 [Bacteroidetes bacterium]|jgi:hypothetical protein|nr:hypothetical protein [Bacteroidota bacterium]